MKTKVWLNLDPQKVDVNYLYKKFEEMGCDFEAEAIPDNDPELLVKKAQNVDIVVATMEPWNETTLGAVKGKVKFIQKYGTGVDCGCRGRHDAYIEFRQTIYSVCRGL